jgi:antitoxin MazE
MKVNLVAVGNSRGVRLPKAIIEQCGFGDAVELTVEDGRVVLSRPQAPRAGWAEAFAGGEDAAPLLPDDASRDWDEAEWRW